MINKKSVIIISLFLLMIIPFVSASQINSTSADGLVAYSTSTVQSPKFRLWNDTAKFGSELTDTNSVSANIYWIVTKGSHERDEIIVGTLDDATDGTNDINIQVYTPSNGWSNLQEVSTGITNTDYRSFDIEYEDISGDALIVYENSTTADSDVTYRIWNGTSYTSEETLATTMTSGIMNWVMLFSRSGSDEIMLLLHNDQNELYSVLWNGTGFDTSKALLTSSTVSNTVQHFSFAWENSSGEGLLGYGTGTDFAYVVYDTDLPTHWAGAATIALGDALSATRLCSDPTSDYIGIVWQDAGKDVNARMWDGASILTSPPAEDDKAAAQGANNVNIDCAWFNSTTALFGFIDNRKKAIDYITFTKTNIWSADLSAAPITSDFASKDIKGMRFTGHPTTSEVMIVVIDKNEDISTIRWDGSTFVFPTTYILETTTQTTDGAQETVMFDWFRYDPAPNVINIQPSGTNFDLETILTINASVLDNINISTVIANITFPNNTIEQLTLTDNDGDNIYNNTFTRTGTKGTYTITIIANDTSVHNNVNDTESTTFSLGDVVYPNVNYTYPAGNTSFSQNENITFKVNVTDNINVSKVLAIITLPDSRTANVTFIAVVNTTLSYPHEYHYNWTNTSIPGTYTIQYYVNDTSNNVNNTVTDTFGVGDSTIPIISILTPTNDTNFDLNTGVNISTNITDADTNISKVFVNVTMTNGTIRRLEMTNVSTTYSFNFTNTTIKGRYNFTIIANDSSDNTQYDYGYFTVGDPVKPVIDLNLPINYYNTTSQSVVFNFTATDNKDTSLNCSIFLDNILNQTNSLTVNNSYTIFTINNLVNGTYSWNVTCNDDSNNQNTSTTRTFTVDSDSPRFVSLTTTPSDADNLDPHVVVKVRSNVTDNLTSISVVILEYRFEDNLTYTNLTMNLVNSTTYGYNTTFNANYSGVYYFKLWANDTLGTADYSTEKNITVEKDYTWTISTTEFDAVTADLNTNITVGNFTINNTGDYSFNINITSDSSYNFTWFNETDFNLSSGSLRHIQINDSTNVSGTRSRTYTITASPNADPTSRTISATIVVAPGQPVLVATFTTPSTDTLSVIQGQTGVEFAATLKNIGEGNASNYTFFIEIPDEWTVTSGQLNKSFKDDFILASGETEENSIRVTIPNNFSTDSYIINVSATGLNGSGIDLSDLSLVFTDSVNVTVNSKTADLGRVQASGGGPSSTTTPTTTPSGSSGKKSVASVGGTVVKSAAGETLYTTETLEIVRGGTEETLITIANLYENAILDNLSVSLEGFMSQYVEIEPIIDYDKLVFVETKYLTLTELREHLRFSLGKETHNITVTKRDKDYGIFTIYSNIISFSLSKGNIKYLDLDNDNKNDAAVILEDITKNTTKLTVHKLGRPDPNKLYYKEERQYSLRISAPTYLEQEDYNLTVKITANIVAVNPQLAGFTTKPLTEFRKLLFRIREMPIEEVTATVLQAYQDWQDMIDAGFSTKRIEDLYWKAHSAFNKSDFKLVSKFIKQISQIRKYAFEADDLINKVRNGINKANEQWLKVPETEATIKLALNAFKREDFETALQRAKDAELTLILETKGRVNIIWFLSQYWLAILLSVIFLAIISFFIYKRLIISIISQRLKNLAKEETSINSLIKEAQIKHLKEGTMSDIEYRKRIVQYESRLNVIAQLIIKLRNKRVGIVKTEQELDNLEREEKDLYDLMKKRQVDYFKKGSLSRKKFMDVYKSDKRRLAEVEGEKELVKGKLEKEKISKKYKFLSFINNIYLGIKGIFEIKKNNVKSNVKEKEKEKKKEKKKEDKKKNKKEKKKENEKNKGNNMGPIVKSHKIIKKLKKEKENKIEPLYKTAPSKEVKHSELNNMFNWLLTKEVPEEAPEGDEDLGNQDSSFYFDQLIEEKPKSKVFSIQIRDKHELVPIELIEKVIKEGSIKEGINANQQEFRINLKEEVRRLNEKRRQRDMDNLERFGFKTKKK